MQIYLAGPLFSIAEKEFNLTLAEKLKSLMDEIEIIIPQLYSQHILSDPDFTDKVFNYCTKSITDCDLVVAILEGSDADSGTCIELGMAYAQQIPVIGVRTDFRSSEDRGLNLMVSNVCRALIWNSSFNLDELAKEIKNKIDDLGLS